MKILRTILMLAVVFTTALSAEAQKKGEKTVVFNAVLHCESCKAKVEKNIPFEKGVKDLKIDMKAQTIAVTYREDKNNAENLQKAIEKLQVEVKGTVGGKGEKQGAACCPGDKKDCSKKGSK